MKINRFSSKEMTSWPKTDANLILIFEILLMSAFLMMNTADLCLQNIAEEQLDLKAKYPNTGKPHSCMVMKIIKFF